MCLLKFGFLFCTYCGMQTRCWATTARKANILQPLLSNGFANKRVSIATIGYSNREKVVSVGSVPRCHKQDSWSNELVVRQSPAGKNVSTEAKDLVGIRHQATTGENTAN
jgi:hypothetical protein